MVGRAAQVSFHLPAESFTWFSVRVMPFLLQNICTRVSDGYQRMVSPDVRAFTPRSVPPKCCASCSVVLVLANAAVSSE